MRTGSRIRLHVWKRLCVSVLGVKQSIYFSRFRKYFGFGGCFCKANSNLLYRIRIRCIELYMVTWFKNIVLQVFEKNVPEVWTIFVLDIWVDNFGIVGPLTSQKHPSKGGIKSLKHPSEGKNQD